MPHHSAFDAVVLPRTIGSLFSGIGGMDLGLEHVTGARTLWQVERDPWCRRLLAARWPEARQYDDVHTVARAGTPLEPVDLVCGGFPCQSSSLAGQRKGVDDARWLWPEFARVLRVVGPRWVMLENVGGLLTASRGRALAQVLGDLAALGYTAEWDLFRASDVEDADGVRAPHRRERWFCVAYRDSARRAWGPGAPGSGGWSESANGGVGVGLADPDGVRERQPQGSLCDERGRAGDCGEGRAVELADADGRGPQGGIAGEERAGVAAAGRGGAGDSRDGIGVGLADTVRLPVQRRGGPRSVACESGDAQGEALKRQRGGDASGGCREAGDEREPGSAPLVHAAGARCEGLPGSRRESSRRLSKISTGGGVTGADGANRDVERRVGRRPHGVSSGLDRSATSAPHEEGPQQEDHGGPRILRASGVFLGDHRWPAGRGEPQCPWEPPRVTRTERDRCARLKALGNACVPGQAALAWRVLLAQLLARLAEENP